MKKLFTLSLFLFSIQVTFSQLSKWEENFVRTYDPQTYSYYKFGQGISNQGKQIANSLSRQLDRYQSLISTQDPDALLADFQSKMQNIQNLEQRYVENANTFAYNAGQQIGNAINRKDGMAAISGLIGFADQMSAQKEAKRKLEAQKAKLRQQRVNKMSQVYWKAVKFNEGKIQEYINRAAYARNIKDEKYNLEFVKNLKCFAGDMKRYWSSTSTSWLTNRCTKPVKPTINSIENKFIAKDVQTRKVAERKYKFYLESKYEQFRSAAISYAAAAAKQNGSAANYFLLGKYYLEENPILGLSTLLTVQSINPNYKKEELNNLIQQATDDTTRDIRKALSDNDVSYLNSFLNSGLDRLIKIDGKSILTEAITLDKPDAVQTILNKYIDGLPQNKINEKINKTILLCALKNSKKTLIRFEELGVNLDFKMGNFHPMDLAIKGNASDVYDYLSTKISDVKVYNNKYPNSPLILTKSLDKNPAELISIFDKLQDESKFIVAKHLMEVISKDNIKLFNALKSNSSIKEFIKASKPLNKLGVQKFQREILKEADNSLAFELLELDLVEIKKIYWIESDILKDKKNESDENFVKSLNDLQKGAYLAGMESYNYIKDNPKRISEYELGTKRSFKTFKSDLRAAIKREHSDNLKLLRQTYYKANLKYMMLDKFSGDENKPDKSDNRILNNSTILHAAFNNNHDKLYAFLDEKFDLSQVSGFQKYALTFADKLSSNQIYQSADFKFTSLQELIKPFWNSNKDFSFLKTIINNYKIDVNERGENGGTLLHRAIRELNENSLWDTWYKSETYYENTSLVRLRSVLKLGIDVNVKDNDGLTAKTLFSKTRKDRKGGWRYRLGAITTVDKNGKYLDGGKIIKQIEKEITNALE